GGTSQVTDAEKLWTLCAETLRRRVSEATWMTWFDAVRPQGMEGDVLVLAVPSSLAKEKIEGRYLETMRNVMTDAVGLDVPIRLEVRTGAVPADGGSTLLSGNDWSRPLGGEGEGVASPRGEG